MRSTLEFLSKTVAKSEARETRPAWQVNAMRRPAQQPRPLLRRIFGREEPTTYQRCLAVHMFFSGPRSGLS
jgi:hypothetical protein